METNEPCRSDTKVWDSVLIGQKLISWLEIDGVSVADQELDTDIE